AEQRQFRFASGGVLPVGERAGLDDVTAGRANRRRGRLRFGRGGFLAVIVVTGAAGAAVAAVAVAAVRRVAFLRNDDFVVGQHFVERKAWLLGLGFLFTLRGLVRVFRLFRLRRLWHFGRRDGAPRLPGGSGHDVHRRGH